MVALLYLLIPFLGLGRAVSSLRLVLASFVAGAAGGGTQAANSTAPQPPLSAFFFSSFALVYLVRWQRWCWCARYLLDAFAEHLRLEGFFFLKKKHFSRSWEKLDGEQQTLYNFENAALVNRCKLINGS